MAGQLTIDTLRASSGVLATQNGMTGIGKAWVNFVGSTAVISGSFNVSSVTRSGTGQYIVNFTTALSSANNSATSNCIFTSNGTNGVTMFIQAQSTTTCTLIATDLRGGTNYADPSLVCVSVSGT
jgi:hypothetical protein